MGRIYKPFICLTKETHPAHVDRLPEGGGGNRGSPDQGQGKHIQPKKGSKVMTRSLGYDTLEGYLAFPSSAEGAAPPDDASSSRLRHFQS